MNWSKTADQLAEDLRDDHPVLAADDSPAPSEEEILNIGRILSQAGVIRQVRDVEIISSPLRIFGSVILQGGRFRGDRFLAPRICGGSGFTPEQARLRAYGEAAERFCSGFYNESDLRLSSHRQLAGAAVTPESFALFNREQYEAPGFEYRPFEEDARINWVQGYSLTRQEPVFVPAAFVHLPYWPVGGETPIGLFTSTGLSCGGSLVEAVLRGLLEVIERDAIMLMWLNRRAAGRVDVESLGDGRLRDLAASHENGDIRVFDITTDIPIPTRFALLTDFYRGRSLVSCGAATRWNSRSASEKAVIEALVVRQAVQKIIRTHPPRTYGKDYQKVREIEDHMNLYTDPQMLPALDFLTGMHARPESGLDEPAREDAFSRQLGTCLDLLAERNLEGIVVDLTRPEVAEAGLSVVRVLIPGMIPLSFGAGQVCAGGRRISEVPQALGYGIADGRLNPVPHPFA